MALCLPEKHPSDGRAAWSPSDQQAFTYLRDFAGSVPFIAPSQNVDGSDLGDLFRDVHAFNAALPFSEGERLWALNSFRAGRTLGVLDAVELWTPIETEVVSAGVKQRLVGRELVRRWSAWRRGLDEYEDGSGVQEATSRIRKIGRELLAGVSVE